MIVFVETGKLELIFKIYLLQDAIWEKYLN